jgi:hypothetical protein
MKRSYLLFISLGCFVIAGLLLTLIGCTTFSPIETFKGHVCFDLYVVPTPAEMPSACRENNWEACYVGKSNSIWMEGKRSVENYIYVRDDLLGHEVKHVLSTQFKERWENPDYPAKFFTNF